ncbi:MAG TPA: hypothetical protein VEW03_01635 [Longimicrobiaceae bacterium]|nr:hypothetical protein [Longimicrobiaceae bacterium]
MSTTPTLAPAVLQGTLTIMLPLGAGGLFTVILDFGVWGPVGGPAEKVTVTVRNEVTTPGPVIGEAALTPAQPSLNVNLPPQFIGPNTIGASFKLTADFEGGVLNYSGSESSQVITTTYSGTAVTWNALSTTTLPPEPPGGMLG